MSAPLHYDIPPVIARLEAEWRSLIDKARAVATDPAEATALAAQEMFVDMFVAIARGELEGLNRGLELKDLAWGVGAMIGSWMTRRPALAQAAFLEGLDGALEAETKGLQAQPVHAEPCRGGHA